MNRQKLPVTDEEIKDLLESGLRTCDITRSYKTGKDRIARIRKEHNIKVSKQPKKELEPIDRGKVRQLFRRGYTRTYIVENYAITPDEVERYKIEFDGSQVCEEDGCENKAVEKMRTMKEGVKEARWICYECMCPDQTEEEKQAIRNGTNRSMISDCEEYAPGKPGLAGYVKSYKELGIRADMDFGRITR